MLNTVGLFALMVSDRRIYPPRVVPHQTVESSVCLIKVYFITAWGQATLVQPPPGEGLVRGTRDQLFF